MKFPGFIILFIALYSSTLFAQNGRLRVAGEAMREFDYMTAIVLYQQILQQEDNMDAKINLAECYRKINDTDNAEYWYGQVLRLPNPKPMYKLYYGMMLQANGKNALAKSWFQQYLSDNPDDARAQYLLRACDLEQELKLKNRDVYVVNAMPFNSNLDDFSPTIIGSRIVFASDRDRGTLVKRTSMWTGNPFSDLYVAPFQKAGLSPGDFVFETPEKFSKELNTKYNEAAVAISPDSQTIYFTRNNYLDGKLGRSEDGLVKLKIYSAHKDVTGNWGDIKSLPFNSDEYYTAFPSLSADGKRLYFSCNMPGGYGGMDLYVSNNDNDQWGAPINLGPIVNTEGNEIFPFVTPDNRLYFASNGQIGLGGLDIFYTTSNGKQDEWNLPVNLGGPINSNHDDFAITFGGDQSWGFFTSDRDGGVGRDDVYGFQKFALPVEIVVTDALTKAPMSGVAVTNNKSNLTFTSGKDGKVAFDMRYAECADFTVFKKGYEAAKKQVCVDSVNNGIITRVAVQIQKQANFTVQGMVFDMTDGLPADEASIMLLNDCGKPIPEAVQTSSDGRYKFKLDKDCCYTIRAVHDGYIAGVSEQICTRNLTSSNHFKVNLNLQPYRESGGTATNVKRNLTAVEAAPHFNTWSGLYENADGSPASFEMGEGVVVKSGVMFDNGVPVKPEKTDWAKNATGFLINLYYDFNQINVSSASQAELERLFRTLHDNPDLHIEIASHTDARGSDDYNLQLSQQRAEAVVRWLVVQGVQANRLSARGYGETQLINHCINDVNCTEAEHQMNRRTEFRILGTGGDTISVPKQGVKVAPCEGCPF